MSPSIRRYIDLFTRYVGPRWPRAVLLGVLIARVFFGSLQPGNVEEQAESVAHRSEVLHMGFSKAVPEQCKMSPAAAARTLPYLMHST